MDNMAGVTENCSVAQGTDMLRRYWGITALSCPQKRKSGRIQTEEVVSHQDGCSDVVESEGQFHGTSQKTEKKKNYEKYNKI